MQELEFSNEIIHSQPTRKNPPDIFSRVLVVKTQRLLCPTVKCFNERTSEKREIFGWCTLKAAELLQLNQRRRLEQSTG